MKRKTIILGVLAILCIFWMGGYGLRLYGEYLDKKMAWNEEAKASFEDALWIEVDKRSEIPIYSSSLPQEGMVTLKQMIPDSVSVMTKEGFRRYKIERYKYDRSLIQDTHKRSFLATLLAEYPLSIDTLGMNWDSLLVDKQIPLSAKIRYVLTDLQLQNDTTYFATDSKLRFDSLSVNYMGFRCEHELAAFVSYPHWLSVLDTSDWCFWFLPWGVLGLLAAFYVPLEKFFHRKFVEVKIVEKEIHVADVAIDEAKVYQLPDGSLFDSFTGTLTKGNLSKQLPPQSGILLKLFLRKENNRLSASEIEQKLWNGQSTTDQLHKAIQRLRADLKKVSSEVVIKNVSGDYELKLPISSNDSGVKPICKT